MDNITVNGLAMLAFATDEQLEQWKQRTREKQEVAQQRRAVIRTQVAVGYTENISRPGVDVYVTKRPSGYIELMYRKSIIEDEDQLQEAGSGRRRYVKNYSRSSGPGYSKIGSGGNRSGNRKHVNYYTRHDKYARYERYERHEKYSRYDKYDRRAPERPRETRPTRPTTPRPDPRYDRIDRYYKQPIYTVGPTRPTYYDRPTYYYDRPTYYYDRPTYYYRRSYNPTPYVPEYTPSGSYNRTDFENAAIKHTAKWEENRQEYNEIGVNRPANTFFAGEKFIIDVTFTTDSSGSYDDSKTLKKVSINDTSYSTNIIETSQNGTTVKQTAVLWDNSMIKKWGDGKKHTVTFTLEFNDGTKREVTAYVKNTTIDFLHRG